MVLELGDKNITVRGTKEEILALLRQSYKDCRELQHLVLIARGRNVIYSFSVSSSRFIVKVGVLDDSRKRLIRHAVLAHLLGKAGCSVEQPLFTTSGEPFSQNTNGLTAVVFRRIEGYPGDFSEATYKRLGAALAQLHQMATLACIPTNMLSNLTPILVVEQAERKILCRLSGTAYENKLRDCIQFISSSLKCLSPSRFDVTFGHGDPHPFNIMFTNGRLQHSATWIDLEDAFCGFRLFDLGTVVWSTLRCKQTKPLWMAALQSYDQCNTLAVDELDYLGRFVALRQLWWLSMHAENWGKYEIHLKEPSFLESGIELLEIICRDACGM